MPTLYLNNIKTKNKQIDKLKNTYAQTYFDYCEDVSLNTSTHVFQIWKQISQQSQKYLVNTNVKLFILEYRTSFCYIVIGFYFIWVTVYCKQNCSELMLYIVVLCTICWSCMRNQRKINILFGNQIYLRLL